MFAACTRANSSTCSISWSGLAGFLYPQPLRLPCADLVAQLPPVGAAEVLRDCLPSIRVPRVRLTRGFRQAA